MTDKNLTVIDTYIQDRPAEIQPVLFAIRDAIREVLPDAQERISWQMPTYWHGKNIIHFAAHTKHVGLYPGPDAIEHFAGELEGFKRSKGAIQFPYDRELPLDLIGRIAAWCKETGHHH